MAYTPSNFATSPSIVELAIASGCDRSQLLGLAEEFEAEALAEKKQRSPLGSPLLREHDAALLLQLR